MLPWSELYRLLRSDQGQPALQLEFQTVSTSAAAVSVAATYTLDQQDRHLILLAAEVETAAGAAQFGNDCSLAIGSPASDAVTKNIQIRAANPAVEPAPAAASPRRYDWSGFLIVPPKWRIVATGSFNAAGVANLTRLYIAGVIVPRGTFSRP